MMIHLIEIRQRLIRCLVAFVLLLVVSFIFAQNLFAWLMLPLMGSLSKGQELIATHVTASVLTPLTIATDAALLASAPYILCQIWLFVAPGLYQRERNYLSRMMLASVVLFLLGLGFCFLVVLPLMMRFFIHALPEGVHFMPDISHAAHFILHMMLVFGICFQLPLLCMLVVRLELISKTKLKVLRPYVIVGSFVIGMLLTPPDVFSQVMLAIPLCLLYEVGLFLS